MVILTDDEDRENEGDLVVAASQITPAIVNFMATHGRGLICVPILRERAQQLGLQRMVLDNRESFRTDFTVSVDAKHGVTTGISAADRAKAIQILSSSESVPHDLVQPGHIFPLQAKPGGVLQRAGHTEAAVDLARLCGLDPSAVICEILKPDGSMARLPDLLAFSKKFKIKIGNIRDLIEYRRQTEKLVAIEEQIKMPTDYGDFEFYSFISKLDGQHHLALVKGKIDSKKPILVRVHSECLVGDVFGSRRSDSENQLHDALKMIECEKSGILVYMRQEVRRIGLSSKNHLFKSQEQGNDPEETNLKHGFPSDLREYGLGAQILHELGVRQIKLLTDNPKKVVGLSGYGLEIVSQIPMHVKSNPLNKKNLKRKK